MRHSMMGYLYILAGGAVSWTSKCQPSTALSMTIAEYMSVTQVAKEAIWLTALLKEIEIRTTEEPMIIKVDNQGSIHLAKNPKYHARTKHINIQYHFIREMIEMKKVELIYCPMQDNAADMLTKPLARVARPQAVYRACPARPCWRHMPRIPGRATRVACAPNRYAHASHPSPAGSCAGQRLGPGT